MKQTDSPQPIKVAQAQPVDSHEDRPTRRRSILTWLAKVGGVCVTFSTIAFGIGQCEASRAAQREKNAQLITGLVEKATNDPKTRSDAARVLIREISPGVADVLDSDEASANLVNDDDSVSGTKRIIQIDDFDAIDSASIAMVPDSIIRRVQQRRQTLYPDSSSVQIAATPIGPTLSSTTVTSDSANRPVVTTRNVGGLYRVGPVFRCGGVCQPGQACCAVDVVYTPEQ